jgi:rare lipoprotein A
MKSGDSLIGTVVGAAIAGFLFGAPVGFGVRDRIFADPPAAAAVDLELPAVEVKPTSTRIVLASWYGEPFHGRQTANQEIFDKEAMTAASKTLRLGTVVLVENLETGQAAVVRINDRGPYVGRRELDLSEAAAAAIGLKEDGVRLVRITVIE